MNLTDMFNNNSTGETALMHAVKNGDANTVKNLLDLGGNVNLVPPAATIPPAGSAPRAPAATTAGMPEPPTATEVTDMATKREVKAPPTARFKKKPQKRKTTL